MTEKILAVIPCLNEDAHIEQLVRDLVAHCATLPVHIVIADGGSADRTVEIAQALEREFDQVSYLYNPKKIQSAAVNLAVKTYGAEATWLIRIDAHAGYPADYCLSLLAEAARTGADSVVVSMDTVGEEGFQRLVAETQNSKLGNGGAAHRNVAGTPDGGRWVGHGHHALMRLTAFVQVGGYDEDFSHNEDAELDVRLMEAGYKIWLTAATVVTYYPRATPEGLFRQYFQFGQGRFRTIFKHMMMPRGRQALPILVLPATMLLLFSGIFGWIALPFLIWAGACLGYSTIWAVQKNDISLAAIGPIAMLMHFAWSAGFWREAVGVLMEKQD